MRDYYVQYGVPSAHSYVVSFHDGEKKHFDGSAFYDIRIFHSVKAVDDFVKELKADGYQERKDVV